jgi:membrane protein YdbS with pleckstrin-like domain
MLQPGGIGEDAWRRPSRKLLSLRRLEVAGTAAAAAAALGVVLGIEVGLVAALAAVAAAAAAGGGALWVVTRRYAAWGYAEREDDLLVRRGVLVFRLSVVPYGRMQFIDVRAGPLERAFQLATVHLHTAAAATDARVPGLEQEEAARLRDRLAALGEARAAGL